MSVRPRWPFSTVSHVLWVRTSPLAPSTLCPSMLTPFLYEHGLVVLGNPRWEGKLLEPIDKSFAACRTYGSAWSTENHFVGLRYTAALTSHCVHLCRNYGPTIRIQKEAESKGCNQVLWLLGDDYQVRASVM